MSSRELRIVLTTPPLVIGAVGLFQMDPFKAAVGSTLEEILSPLMPGLERQRRPAFPPATGSIDAYPLVIPDQDTLDIPLQDGWLLTVGNDGGHILLQVPYEWAQAVYDRARVHTAAPPKNVSRGDRSGHERWYTRMLFRMPSANSALRMPVGKFGEFGLYPMGVL